MIYHEYYRDQNLIPEDRSIYQLDPGNNATTGKTTLRKRAWQHDYLTSALPWTQRGAEALLPLGTEAPIFAYNDTNLPPQGFPLNPPIVTGKLFF